MGTATSSARYTYRLRVGTAAERLLLSEWDRCRWVWNQCVAESRAAYERGEKIGPAALDKMCTTWRAERAWLRAGHPGFGRNTSAELAAADRAVSRRRRPKGQQQSNSYRKAKRRRARLRDKNSARVMLNRAGLNQDGVDRGRPVQSPTGKAA